MNDNIYDVLVVGAGPAGLEAALILGRQQRQVCLVDSGRPRNAGVEQFHMYLGLDGGNPAELRAAARAEVNAHPNVTFIDDTVISFSGHLDDFTAITADQLSLRARTVLLCCGIRDRLPEIAGLAERWGRNIVHCAYCYGHESRGRRIAVVALQPTDALLARYLADRFSQAVVLHSGAILGDAQQELDIARAGGVEVTALGVTSFGGSDDLVELKLSDGTSSTAEIVFLRPATELTNDLATQLGCELTADGLVAVSVTQQTSVPGVFAAGDAARFREASAPVQFVLASAGAGQHAAVWIEQHLFSSALTT